MPFLVLARLSSSHGQRSISSLVSALSAYFLVSIFRSFSKCKVRCGGIGISWAALLLHAPFDNNTYFDPARA